ncbi:DUF1275 family protein [[Flexibacter] sp. ATCC 35208]|uniref:DUF1275 family protein n=1 Tax=[Flexibacter] sp. ATCC 35208 TaxID=1936242 RepID=UPI00117E8B34|nr:YoaK family protein [[Flexibacter] sp. ATCC 35208]
MAAVMIGGWLARVLVRKYRIMLGESVLLMLTGVLAMFLPLMSSFMLYLLVFMVVVAMGLQNAFGKLFAKETHGPGTMMTGNVTQAALDLGNLVRTGFKEPAAMQRFRNVSILIGGFLLGCLMGAIMARYLGLTSIIGPGVAICICYLMREALPRKQLV